MKLVEKIGVEQRSQVAKGSRSDLYRSPEKMPYPFLNRGCNSGVWICLTAFGITVDAFIWVALRTLRDQGSKVRCGRMRRVRRAGTF